MVIKEILVLIVFTSQRCILSHKHVIQYWSLLNWHNLRLRCGSCKLTFWHYFIMFCELRMLYIVWSLVRRRVTRRLTWLQTMCNVLKHREMLQNVTVWLHLIFSIYLKPVLYLHHIVLCLAEFFGRDIVFPSVPWTILSQT